MSWMQMSCSHYFGGNHYNVSFPGNKGYTHGFRMKDLCFYSFVVIFCCSYEKGLDPCRECVAKYKYRICSLMSTE